MPAHLQINQRMSRQPDCVLGAWQTHSPSLKGLSLGTEWQLSPGLALSPCWQTKWLLNCQVSKECLTSGGSWPCTSFNACLVSFLSLIVNSLRLYNIVFKQNPRHLRVWIFVRLQFGIHLHTPKSQISSALWNSFLSSHHGPRSKVSARNN